jgi:hypothetical protein
MQVTGYSSQTLHGTQTRTVFVGGGQHGSQQESQHESQQSCRWNKRRSLLPKRWKWLSQGTSRHSQCPWSTQRRAIVVTGLQVTHVCMTVRSSTVGTQTHTQRVIVCTSGTRL